MRSSIESKNITKEKMRGFTTEEIKCWGCQAPFCGHRIVELIEGVPMPLCSLREASREVLGMVKPELLDHDFNDDELDSFTKKELACNNCKGRACGYKGMRSINGKRMRVCLKDERNRRVLNMEEKDASPYIDQLDFKAGW